MDELDDGQLMYHAACLSCDSSDAMAVYEKAGDDGELFLDGYCFSCRTYFSANRLEGVTLEASETNNRNSTDKSELTVDQVHDFTSSGSRKRGIRKEFMELYGVKMQFRGDGSVSHHYYPVTKKGKITGYKPRELPKNFNLRQIGDTKAKGAELFGQHIFQEGKVQVNKKWLCITEGELDAVALQQVLTDKGNPSYRNAVVSINSGAGSAVKSIQQNWKWVNSFEQVILFFDQDEAGKRAAMDVAKKLPLGKCKIAKYSSKDACDMLKEGKADELYNAFWKSETYAPDGVLAGSGLWNLVTTPLTESNAHYPWSGLDKMLHGIRPSELVTLTAGCVDADTEFLTPTGWKRIADYQEGDKVAQYHQNGSISYIEPIQYHKYEAESLWHVRTKYGVDQCLSDEHNVVYLSDKGNICKKSLAEVRQTQQETVRGFSGRFLTTFSGGRNEGLALSDDEIRLMVAVMADGNFRSDTTNHVGVRAKKERKKARLHNLLEKIGVGYSVKEVAPYDGFVQFKFYAPLRMKNYGEFWWDASQDQLQIICEEALHWDGNCKDQFYSSDKEDIDFLQYAYAAIGKRTTVLVDDRMTRNTDRPCYRLQIAGNDTVGIKADAGNKPQFKQYKTSDGCKYCFTTETGMWVMRRNYRICVTGNSGVAKSTFARMIAHHLQKTTGENVGMIFLEESVKKTCLQIMSLEIGKQLHLPETEVDDEAMQTAFDGTLGTGQYYFFDDFASQDFEAIAESIVYMARAANVKYIFLDHISMLVSGGEQSDERRALDAICTKLRSLVQQLDITLFAITHLKRPQGTAHEEGGATSLAQLRGSAGIAQLSDIVIGFERNGQAEDEKERNTTHVRVLKNRFSGEVSLACSLWYDKETGWARELYEEEVEFMETEESEFDQGAIPVADF